MENVTITLNAARKRFETVQDGHTAWLSFARLPDGNLAYEHTIVPPELGGRERGGVPPAAEPPQGGRGPLGGTEAKRQSIALPAGVGSRFSGDVEESDRPRSGLARTWGLLSPPGLQFRPNLYRAPPAISTAAAGVMGASSPVPRVR